MAQRLQMLLTCDVHDGDAEAAKTVTFMVEGRSYEYELCEVHLAEFRVAMEVWSSHAPGGGEGEPRSVADPARPPPPPGRHGRRRPVDGRRPRLGPGARHGGRRPWPGP